MAAETMSKAEANKAFSQVVKEVEQDLKALVSGAKSERPVGELKEVQVKSLERLKQLSLMYKSKGQRRASAPREGITNGFCKPMVAHADLRAFFTKASNLGFSQPFNYEVSREGFEDEQGRRHQIRLKTESGEYLYGPACYGKGIASKASKTNVQMLDILKSLRTTGITSQTQIGYLFTIYFIVNGLKTGANYHVDSHMEKYLGTGLKHIESTSNFNRKSFSHCNLMKIVAYYAKKDVITATHQTVKSWADKCGLTIEEFTKSHGISKEERSAYTDASGKVRDDVVKAIEAESVIISSANMMYKYHSMIVPEKKPRVVKEKAPKPEKAVAATDKTDKKPAVPRGGKKPTEAASVESTTLTPAQKAAATRAANAAAKSAAVPTPAAAKTVVKTAAPVPVVTAKTAPVAAKPATAQKTVAAKK